MNSNHKIVVVGGGHSAAQLCAGLAEAGMGACVHLVCEEPVLPYQRPPLSKSFLKNPQESTLAIRATEWYAQTGITVYQGDPAIELSRKNGTVKLKSGQVLPYSLAVLATGTRARQLPNMPAGLTNVVSLRTAQDALQIRKQLQTVNKVTILGGGFIGLELAATAAALGKSVTVLESAPRLLGRSVSPELGEHVLQTHRAAGINVRLGVKVDNLVVKGKQLVHMNVDCQSEPVEWLLLGIGAEPEVTLARDAGLTCDNGIEVDAGMRTSDPAILAIGDCTNFLQAGTDRRLRLESVQNANDQARTALATLLGRDEPYQALPWFWSEQGSMRLQMAGLMPAQGERHRRDGVNPGSFSILHYVADRLVCVESVNAPMDHMAARKLLETGKSPSPAQACDAAQPMKSFL